MEPCKNNWIDEIVEFLEENYRDEISVDMLSEHFFVSKYHLMRQFKRFTGNTIHSFILMRRVECACQLIKHSTPPVRACYLSGFQDYSLFFRSFIRFTGVVPSEYHLKCQNLD